MSFFAARSFQSLFFQAPILLFYATPLLKTFLLVLACNFILSQIGQSFILWSAAKKYTKSLFVLLQIFRRIMQRWKMHLGFLCWKWLLISKGVLNLCYWNKIFSAGFWTQRGINMFQATAQLRRDFANFCDKVNEITIVQLVKFLLLNIEKAKRVSGLFWILFECSLDRTNGNFFSSQDKWAPFIYYLKIICKSLHPNRGSKAKIFYYSKISLILPRSSLII